MVRRDAGDEAVSHSMQGKAKKTRKFAEVKRLINPKEEKLCGMESGDGPFCCLLFCW